MPIKNIYTKFGISQNLALHMMIVASIAFYIGNHWIGPKLDWEKVKKTSLLHDIGNLVKSDLDENQKFLGGEINRLSYWKDLQRKAFEKYGTADHEATRKMLNELIVDPDIVDVILNKSFDNSIHTANSQDWYPKVLHYSDLRVLPRGVASLEARLQDLYKRPCFKN